MNISGEDGGLGRRVGVVSPHRMSLHHPAGETKIKTKVVYPLIIKIVG